MLKSLWNEMWERMHNPWTMHTRVILLLLLCYALWRHDPALIIVCIIALLANPFYMSKPVHLEKESWYYKTVEGSRRWLKETNKIILAISYIAGLRIFIFMIYFKELSSPYLMLHIPLMIGVMIVYTIIFSRTLARTLNENIKALATLIQKIAE